MEVPAKLRSAFTGIRYWWLASILFAASTLLVSCGGGGTDTVITITPVADTLSVQVSKTDVFANEQVTITAYATNAGQAVENLTVRFVITTNESSAILSATSVLTLANGRASVKYTAGDFNLPATDTITVTASGLTPEIRDINVMPLIDTIAVSVATGEPTTLVADGTTQTIIEALVKDTAGTPVEGVSVKFSTANGGTLCDDSGCTGVTGTSITVVTAVPGLGLDPIASVYLQSENVGPEVVTGETLDADGLPISGSVDITFVPGAPANIELFAIPDNLYADNQSTSTVTATVTDALGHLVADGLYNVIFEVTGGDGGWPVDLISAPVATVGGVATITYTAGDTPGDVDIEATSGSATSTDGVGIITLIAEYVESIVLTLLDKVLDLPDNTLTADQEDYLRVKAVAYNAANNTVLDGTTVSFATHPPGGNAGILLDTGTTMPVTFPTPVTTEDMLDVTTTNGEAIAYLQASGLAGYAYSVSATSGGAFADAPVIFLPGPADATESTLTASPTTIPANGTSTSTLTLVAKDAFGNLVADPDTDDNVLFTTNAGSFVFTSGVTIYPDGTASTKTNGGIALMTLASSFVETSIDAVEVHALIDSIDEVETLTFKKAIEVDPASIALTYSGGSDGTGKLLIVESPSGTTSSRITATIMNGKDPSTPITNDCENNIEFEIIAGPAGIKLDGYDETTDPVTKTTENGVASVILTPGTDPGVVRVQVTALTDNACNPLTTTVTAYSTAIVILSGVPASIVVFPGGDVEEGSSQIFNALVTDAWGNRVADGTAVIFSVTDDGDFGSVCGAGYTGQPVGCGDSDSTTINGVARDRLTWASSLAIGSFYLKGKTEYSSSVSYTYEGAYPAP